MKTFILHPNIVSQPDELVGLIVCFGGDHNDAVDDGDHGKVDEAYNDDK